MLEDQIREFAPRLGIDQFRPKTSRGWLEAACPLAEWTHEKGHDAHPSFAIKINEAGKSVFSCQSCKRKGSLANLAFMMFGFSEDKEYQELGYEIENAESATAAETLPEWDDEAAESAQHATVLDRKKALSRFTLAIESPRCIRYCGRRGILPYTMLRLGLRFHYQDDRVVFPVIDRNKELRGFTGRAMYPKPDMKVKDYFGLQKFELMLGEHKVFSIRHTLRYVVVVEGLFDYAKVLQAGHPCLALLGSNVTPPKLQKLIDLNLPIIWMTDNDEAGYACLYGMIDSETEERKTNTGALHRLDQYVPQLLTKFPKGKVTDPGGLTTAQINRMVKRAKLFSYST